MDTLAFSAFFFNLDRRPAFTLTFVLLAARGAGFRLPFAAVGLRTAEDRFFPAGALRAGRSERTAFTLAMVQYRILGAGQGKEIPYPRKFGRAG